MSLAHKLTIYSLALAISSTAAQAATMTSTVVVSFDEGAGIHSSSTYLGGVPEAEGTWEENGFSVDWTVVDIYDPSRLSPARNDAINDAPFLSDSFGTPSAAASALTFSRSGGGAFALEQFELPDLTFSSYIGEVQYTPFGTGGTLDFASTQFDYVDVVYDNMVLTGVTSGGAVIEVPVNTFLEGAGGAFGNFLTGGDGIVSMAPGQLADLTSLTVELVDPISTADILSPTLEFHGNSLYQTGFEQCLAINSGGGGCILPGVGEFRFSAIFSANGQNWGSAVAVDNFAFSVAAPIPLPASVLLLGVGLLGLAGLRRRKTR